MENKKEESNKSDQTENLENLSTFFEEMGSTGAFYLNESLSTFDHRDKFKINFNYCHIAISKNGGLIAICKKKGFLETDKRSKIINDNVIVMYQTAEIKLYVKINWDYNKRWVVCLDFLPNEELYGLCNDGTIIKFNYVTSKAKEKLTSTILQNEGILKAKFIDNGFAVLTNTGNYYYIKDIKDPKPEMLLIMFMTLKFSNKIDFAIIPPDYSKSKTVELLLTNETGNGVIHIKQLPEGQNFQMKEVGETGEKKYEGISVTYNGQLQDYIKRYSDSKEGEFPQGFGKIDAITLSPNKSKIAFYNSENKIAFVLSSKLYREDEINEDDFEDNSVKKTKFNFSEEDLSEAEIQEIKAILSYKEGYQFLFCGEDTLAIAGQRFIILSKVNSNTTVIYKMYKKGEIEAIHGTLFMKCIQEIDGVRCLTNEGVFLIRKVCKELYDITDPFSDSPSKKLINFYKNALLRKYTSDKDIKELRSNLLFTIRDLQIACAFLFWTNNNDEKNSKEIQLFILKAAQYGKNFVHKEDFNFNRFIEICKKIRIINNLRNNEERPIFITFDEFEDININDLIKILMKYNDFKTALLVCSYLEYDVKKIIQKYIISYIKKMPEERNMEYFMNNKPKDQLNPYQKIFELLEKNPNISFIKLAKRALKYRRKGLAKMLLEHEKSSIIKIPQLIELEKEKALLLSFDTNDFNVLSTVCDKIINTEKDKFLDIVCDMSFKEHRSKILLYLKKNKPDLVIKFLEYTKNYEELINYYLAEFFKSQDDKERIKIIGKCKDYLKVVDYSSGYDYKYYKSYLNNLENSVKFKSECMPGKDKNINIIHYTETEPYKISVYDCYLNGVKRDKMSWIESQNKMLEYSSKKFNILRFRGLLEIHREDEIEKILQKTPLKKLGLTPLNMAEIYYDYKKYDKATEYLKQVKEQESLNYVVDLLKVMEKYHDALEVIISSKDNENMQFMVNDILKKKPHLKRVAEKFCDTYKVSLEFN